MGDFNTEAQRHRGDVAESRDAVGSRVPRDRVAFNAIFVDDTRRCHKIPQVQYLEEGVFPIIDQGDNVIAGYSNLDVGFYADVPVVVFGDHTRIVKYVDRPFFIGADGVKILKVHDGVLARYAFYALKAARIESLGYSRHFKLVKELKFILPPLATQRRIAAVLDQICEMKRNAETRLAKLDLLVKSRFVEMFGEERAICVLSEETELITKGTTPTSIGFKFENTGVNFVKIETFSDDGSLIAAKVAHISDECNNAMKRSQLRAGDLLFSIAGAIGRVAVVPPEILPANTNQALAIVRLKKNSSLIVPYLVHALKSDVVVRQYLGMKQGVAQLNISLKNIGDFEIPLPPLSLQREFAAFVAEVDKLELTVRQEIEKVDLLYRAKLQEYFG